MDVTVLKLNLHGTTMGYLAGFRDGRNILTFAPDFANNPLRPTFSLITHPDFPNAEKLLTAPWIKRQRLHPVLSNLLPEGALRELLAQGLKVHIDDEFQLFTYLGQDLPGALVATPMEPEQIPDYVLQSSGQVKIVTISAEPRTNHFSLAGVQMKFSMLEKDGRYHIAEAGILGDWIIKTPSTKHKFVPLNEYTAMRLAEMAGVNIPDIRLVEIDTLENLPAINLPNEKLAFAIRRFDRAEEKRIHMEDFAQLLVKYPYQKYDSANCEQIGKILYQYTGDSLSNVQQFARRLLINILLANGDAHLKNWSLIYPDTITPELSPAYDIVTTRVYMGDEKKYALNMGKNKDWYKVLFTHFKAWAEKADIPWKAIKPQLIDTLDRARTLWPKALTELPMDDAQQNQLKEHWQRLQADFRIDPF
ncbi:MAG: type II toxin-antitoxin system HipA family toxin [Thermodesulfobacteriota bacterium]|nr:type II toxin-antitoxin system HipA family toxin [Thermodesulfobacteriota bacterium]